MITTKNGVRTIYKGPALKTKCSFCRYWSGHSCMAKENSYYCKDAINEFYAWKNNKNKKPIKSLYKRGK